MLWTLWPAPVGSLRRWNTLLTVADRPWLARLARRRTRSVSHAGVRSIMTSQDFGLGYVAPWDSLDASFVSAAACGVLAHRCKRASCQLDRYAAGMLLAGTANDPDTTERIAADVAGTLGPAAFSFAPMSALLSCLFADVDPLAVVVRARVPFSVVAELDEHLDGAVFEAFVPSGVVAALAGHLGVPLSAPLADVLDACNARLAHRPAAWHLLAHELLAAHEPLAPSAGQNAAPAALAGILAEIDALGPVLDDVAALRTAGAPGTLQDLAAVSR